MASIKSTLIDDLANNLETSNLSNRSLYVDSLYESIMYTTEQELIFESLEGPTVYRFLNDDELKLINSIIKHPKDKSFNKKFQKLDAILKPKGFKRHGTGTNRVVYEPINGEPFVIKIALDRAGSKNNPDEILNQKYLKPFVAKCFDISADGNVGVFEKVYPIENLYQFWSVRESIYKIMEKLIGRFIIDDFGTKAFKNWGIRQGFGPVLLDYADMYILDPTAVYCNTPLELGKEALCHGEIDYDEGMNNLICTKCGSKHKAAEFRGKEKISIYNSRRNIDMGFKCTIIRDGEKIFEVDNGVYTVCNKNREQVVSPVNNIKVTRTFDGYDQSRKELEVKVEKAKKEESESEEKLRTFTVGKSKVIVIKDEVKPTDKQKETKSFVVGNPKVEVRQTGEKSTDLPKYSHTTKETLEDENIDTVMTDSVVVEKDQILENKVTKEIELDTIGNDIKTENTKEETFKMMNIVAKDIINDIGVSIGESVQALEEEKDTFSYGEILSLYTKLNNIIVNRESTEVVKLIEVVPSAFIELSYFKEGTEPSDYYVSLKDLYDIIEDGLLKFFNKLEEVKIEMEENMNEDIPSTFSGAKVNLSDF